MLVSISPTCAYVGLLLGRTTAVRTSDVLFALGLGAHLAVIAAGGFLPRPSTECDASALDDRIDVVAAELIAHDGWGVVQPQVSRGLMMEQTHAREGHGYVVLVAGVDDMVIAHATSRLCYVLHTALVGTLHIVAKGEEGIAAQ